MCFGDIDNAGIVYYPRFVHYFHVSIEEFFNNELRIDYAKVFHKYRLAFPTVHLEADFRSPLRFGDRLEVEVKVLEIGQSSIKWGYRVFRAGEVENPVVEGHNVTVCLDMDAFQKAVIPDWLREALAAYQRRCEADFGAAL